MFFLDICEFVILKQYLYLFYEQKAFHSHFMFSQTKKSCSESRPAQYSWLWLNQEFPFISTYGSTCPTSSFLFHPATFLLPSGLRKDHLTLFWGGWGEIHNWRGSQFLSLSANGGALRQPPRAFDGITRTHSYTHTPTHPHTSSHTSCMTLWKCGLQTVVW